MNQVSRIASGLAPLVIIPLLGYKYGLYYGIIFPT